MNAPTDPMPSRLHFGNSILQIIGSVALSVTYLAVLFLPEGRGNLFAWFGALTIVPLSAAYGLSVYRSVFARSLAFADVVTACCFAFAGLSLFALISNIGEAAVDGQLDTSCLVFAGIGTALAGYGLASAILSLKWGGTLRLAQRSGCRVCGYDKRGHPPDAACSECGNFGRQDRPPSSSIARHSHNRP